MLSTIIKSIINSSITPGCGVFLKWKENGLYKVHEHWRHLDPEDGLIVLLCNCSLSEFKKNFETKNIINKPSNRNRNSYVVYLTEKLK